MLLSEIWLLHVEVRVCFGKNRHTTSCKWYFPSIPSLLLGVSQRGKKQSWKWCRCVSVAFIKSVVVAFFKHTSPNQFQYLHETYCKALGLFVTNTRFCLCCCRRWGGRSVIVCLPLAPLILFAVAKESRKSCTRRFDPKLPARGKAKLGCKVVCSVQPLPNENSSIPLRACFYLVLPFTGLIPFTKFQLP